MAATDEIIKKISRFYLFYGANDYKLNERIAALIKAVIPPGGESFDLDRFDGRKCDPAALINSISTPPVMSPLRVVILGNTDKLSAKGQKMLEEILPKIPEYSVLAMTALKADKRSGLFKKLLARDKVQSFEYKEFSSAEAMGLLVKFAGERERKISPQIADMMVTIFGADPYKLENEIEKVSLFSPGKPEIEKRDLANMSGFNRVETAYDLPDYIIAGDIGKALELTGRSLMSGISEVQILYILRNFLIRLNCGCRARDVKGLMSSCRVPFPVARAILAQSKKVRPAAILKGLTYIFRAEYSLKSARFPSETVMELLVTALFLVLSGNKTGF